MIRWFAALAVVTALAGCASTPEPEKGGEGAKPASPPNASGTAQDLDPVAAAQRELRLGRALMSIDQRVDRYAYLSSQPGDDARSERNLLGPALSAQVAEFRRELIPMAGDASNPERRRIAVKALAFSDDPAAVGVLVKCLSETADARLLTNATFALGRIHSPSTDAAALLRLVSHPDPDVRSNTLMALWHVFDARRAVGASPIDPVSQRNAMSLIELELFDPADPIIRAHAAAVVGALGDPRGVDPLLNLLRDEHPFVRTHTAIALDKLGDPKAIPALIKVMDTTPIGTPRRVVVLAVTSLFEKQGVHPPESLGDESRAWERWIREREANLGR
jgi:HEAT repeat protein